MTAGTDQDTTIITLIAKYWGWTTEEAISQIFKEGLNTLVAMTIQDIETMREENIKE